MPEFSSDQIQKNNISDRFIDPVIRFLETFFDENFGSGSVVVQDFESFNLVHVDAKPRIVTELTNVDWSNLVVDHLQKMNLTLTSTTHTDLVQGIVTVFCVSKNAQEARNIANIVLEAIRMFRAELRREGGFFSVDSVGYGRVQRIRSSSAAEVRAVPVTIRLSLKRTYVQASNEALFEAAGG